MAVADQWIALLIALLPYAGGPVGQCDPQHPAAHPAGQVGGITDSGLGPPTATSATHGPPPTWRTRPALWAGVAPGWYRACNPSCVCEGGGGQNGQWAAGDRHARSSCAPRSLSGFQGLPLNLLLTPSARVGACRGPSVSAPPSPTPPPTTAAPPPHPPCPLTQPVTFFPSFFLSFFLPFSLCTAPPWTL